MPYPKKTTAKHNYHGNVMIKGSVQADDTIEVWDGTLTIEGDVGSHARIRQHGAGKIVINGRVGVGAEIVADGDIHVDGPVAAGQRSSKWRAAGYTYRHPGEDGVTLKSGGDITVGAGVGNFAELEAGGSISAISIASDSKVHAGKDVSVKYTIYRGCDVKVGGKISAREIGEDVNITQGEKASWRSRICRGDEGGVIGRG